MGWFTFFFVPIFPLNFSLIKGRSQWHYLVIKELTYSEVARRIGARDMWSFIAHSFIKTALPAIFFGLAVLFVIEVRSATPASNWVAICFSLGALTLCICNNLSWRKAAIISFLIFAVQSIAYKVFPQLWSPVWLLILGLALLLVIGLYGIRESSRLEKLPDWEPAPTKYFKKFYLVREDGTIMKIEPCRQPQFWH